MNIYRNLGGGGHLCTAVHEWESDVYYDIHVLAWGGGHLCT